MKTKIIEFLIAVAIVAFMFGLAFCFAGYKDKAEAEWSLTKEVTIDPNEFIVFEPYCTESNHIDIEFAYDNNGVSEVLTLDVIKGEIVCNQPPDKAIEIIFKSLCSAYNIREVENWPVRFPEPKYPTIETSLIERMVRWNDWIGAKIYFKE